MSDSFSASAQETPAIEGVQILGRAGRGGMSTVYKATHLGLGRVVAIKILHREPGGELTLKAQARIDRNRKRRTPATSRSAP